MCLKVNVGVPTLEPPISSDANTTSLDTQKIIVSNEITCVPKSHIKFIAPKIAQVIAAQGLPCPSCQESQILLSDCGEDKLRLEVICGRDGAAYEFELTLLSSIGSRIGSGEGLCNE